MKMTNAQQLNLVASLLLATCFTFLMTTPVCSREPHWLPPERCGPENDNALCPPPKCCGEDGVCGRSSSHCGEGCLPEFGTCYGGKNKKRPRVCNSFCVFCCMSDFVEPVLCGSPGASKDSAFYQVNACMCACRGYDLVEDGNPPVDALPPPSDDDLPPPDSSSQSESPPPPDSDSGESRK